MRENAVVWMKPAHKIMHLLGRCQRTLVQNVEPFFTGIGLLPLGKMSLQSLSLNARAAQLLRGAAGRPAALDLISIGLNTLPDDRKRGGLAGSCHAIQPYDPLLALKYLIRDGSLRRIELRISLNGLCPGPVVGKGCIPDADAAPLPATESLWSRGFGELLLEPLPLLRGRSPAGAI